MVAAPGATLALPRRRGPASIQARHAFQVRLYDFGCKDLATGERCEVHLKIDFGGFKVFRSDSEASSPDISWTFKAGFEYTAEFPEKLREQELLVQCLDGADGRLLGEAALDLETLACGPPSVRLALRDPERGPVQGTLKFTCIMKMRSPDLTVTCADLRLFAQGCALPGRLQVGCTLEEARGRATAVQLPHSEEGCWPGPCCSLSFEATLADLLRAPAGEGLRFVVLDDLGMCQGEALLQFRGAFTPRPGEGVSFRVPVAFASSLDGEERLDAGESVGELEGVLLYQNLPLFAQMVGGVCVDGQVEGGWWLVEGLPYPRSLQQPPPAWRDPVEPSGLPGHGAALGPPGEEMESNLDDKQLAEALEQIPLPRPWEAHQERRGGGGALSARLYFADPRSRRTTWRDPRFLPEPWEQRVDPQTGRVYFQYHRTRQTTYVDPRGCPTGWDMRLSKNGDIYFAYAPTQQTTFVDPRGLPGHLEAAVDVHGRMFFKDHESKITSWRDPRDGMPEPLLAEWRRAGSVRWWREQVWREIEETARQRVGFDDEFGQEMDLST